MWNSICMPCCALLLYRCHLEQSSSFLSDNFFLHFSTTFWRLLLQLANQNATTVGGGVVKLHVGFLGGGVVKLHVGFPTNVNSSSHSNLYFHWPIAKEATEKVVKKMSKGCYTLIQNFVQGATARHAALENKEYIQWFRYIKLIVYLIVDVSSQDIMGGKCLWIVLQRVRWN